MAMKLLKGTRELGKITQLGEDYDGKTTIEIEIHEGVALTEIIDTELNFQITPVTFGVDG